MVKACGRAFHYKICDVGFRLLKNERRIGAVWGLILDPRVVAERACLHA